LKNKNKSCAYKKLSVFYNSCLRTFGSHLVRLVCKIYPRSDASTIRKKL
jgi:hypothetical protein